ncbi:hypothetical protein CYMTET_3267 [Cymbomonas tetramitiformis]|uniref:NrS-1 polymerase-like helicase domain-containing protein n=1 Tax=Cymbomonas tetramitiformis TaxID=36881 RepID=A0AAE0H425_9CHLO|nr:hypothetical protein CYMTET_3267 [Cymbomonas tetramitiformis]
MTRPASPDDVIDTRHTHSVDDDGWYSVSKAEISDSSPRRSARAGERRLAPDDETLARSGKLDRYNGECAFCMYGSSAIIIHTNPDPEEPSETASIRYFRVAEFHQLMSTDQETVWLEGGGHRKIFWSKIWYQHPDRKTYSGIAFEPEVEMLPRGYYNLYKGFPISPEPSPAPSGELAVRNYLRLLKEGVACGDEAVYEYLLNWMALAIQKPWVKPEVAIILKGERGDGKNVACRVFGKLFGNHYKVISHPKRFSNSFNTLVANCILLFVDKAVRCENDIKILKNLIAEPFVSLEYESGNSLAFKSYLHIMMSTDDELRLKKGDRRLLHLVTDSKFHGDTAFFATIVDGMRDGGDRHLMHFFLQRGSSHFDCRAMA